MQLQDLLYNYSQQDSMALAEETDTQINAKE